MILPTWTWNCFENRGRVDLVSSWYHQDTAQDGYSQITELSPELNLTFCIWNLKLQDSPTFLENLVFTKKGIVAILSVNIFPVKDEGNESLPQTQIF